VLDLRERCVPGEGISVDALRDAIASNGAPVAPRTAVLLRTGQERYGLADPEFYDYPGMTREGTLFLAEQGAKVLGTDAVGWDRPFPVMRDAFAETGDRREIWDGHFAGREREIFIVQQLDNLAALPPSGFKVGFFPMKLAGCSAAPARVVAFVD
jgi:kynurenine formamidase